MVAAEAGGRVRLAHIENNDKGTVKRFADGQIAADAHVVTDGHAGYDAKSLGQRHHEAAVQAETERRSQHRNRAVALERLARKLAERRRRRKPRVPTRATASSAERRITEKKARSAIKRTRREPRDGD